MWGTVKPMAGVSVIGDKSRAYGHIRPALVQGVDVLEDTANRIERFSKKINQ